MVKTSSSIMQYGYGQTYVYRRSTCLSTPFKDMNKDEDFQFYEGVMERWGEDRVGLLQDKHGIFLRIQHGTNTSGSRVCKWQDIDLNASANLEFFRAPSFDTWLRHFHVLKGMTVSLRRSLSGNKYDANISSGSSVIAEFVKECAIRRYFIAGDWDDWQFHPFAWDASLGCLIFTLPRRLGRNEYFQFQLFLDKDWRLCVHPDREDAGPTISQSNLFGPHDGGEGLNWKILSPKDRTRSVHVKIGEDFRITQVHFGNNDKRLQK
eukprot:gnl/TRDRNA2_/TRDRNA2_45578_c0_seq1.p1 gnl/TRDRNA2_/TRDRNA2_45578_c0~~gnl/TRDRNA2_/TRDRNA2_45578_c0_seq1.p1  ORF type:complete len:264 (-),score=35.52 gnl/TRDRNA2_/TRDRNA2_45578_c0_seq1:40-831(-)